MQNTVRCPICEGKGGRWVNCSQCNGKGKSECHCCNQSIPCNACTGTGKVMDYTQNCETCDGLCYVLEIDDEQGCRLQRLETERDNNPMTRQEAIRRCRNLYGLEIEFIKEVICELGYDALTDEAVRRLAELQHQFELSKILE